jgi:UDP-glucose 4-epimerase
MRTRTALVTGGAGFIGSHVADHLLAAGFHVTILDDLSTGRASNVPSGAEFIRGDIGSPEAVSLIRDRQFTAVLHLAAQIDVRRSVADPGADASINILGSLNVLEAVRAHSPATRVIFASTGGALYGRFVVPPSPETDAKDPEAPYGIAKLSVEYYLAYYARVHGLETVALRFGNVYGPRQDPHGEAGVVAIFCTRLLNREPLTVYGDGTQTRDYVYVHDVADACVKAVEAPLPPADTVDARAFNVGTGVGTSVLELAQVLQQVSNVAVRVVHAPPRAGELQHSSLDNSKLRRQFGWEPNTALHDGLAATFAWSAQAAKRAEPSHS